MYLNTKLKQYTKITLKYITDLNIEATNYESSRERYKRKLLLLWDRQRLLRERGHRTLIIKSDTLDFIKAKTASFPKDTIKKKKGKLQNGRKYSQYLYLRKDLNKNI